jgi:1-acyl-sn-glycerol-3-phosphate acyltransferase
MLMTPHIDADSSDFPGDPTPQPPFGFSDSLRSLALWSIGIPHLASWALVVRAIAEFGDFKRSDGLLKLMSRTVPALCGVKIEVQGGKSIDLNKAYVYVVNHVNIFDMFAIYQAVPQFTRSLEHIDHFSWPFIGPIITAAGQIPVDPKDPKLTAEGVKKATAMLQRGESITVLPEGSRTMDGTVGPFFPGAFRMAIRAKVEVVPMAIRGGRAVSRRGDWRIRPGAEQVLIGKPIPTEGMTIRDVEALSQKARSVIIDLLQQRLSPDV